MSNRIKIGIVGTGQVVRGSHIPILKKMSDSVEVAGICSKNFENAKKLSNDFPNCKPFKTYQKMFSCENIDAVIIAVPIINNVDIFLSAFKKNKHILIEKPLAANKKLAFMLYQVGKTGKKVYMVGEQFRYIETYRYLKKLLISRKVGNCRLAICRSIVHINTKSQTDWRRNPEHIGGYIKDGGVHFSSILRDLFGDPVSGVSCVSNTDLPGNPISSLYYNYKSEKQTNVVFEYLRTPLFGSTNQYQLLLHCDLGTVRVEFDKLIIEKFGDTLHITEVLNKNPVESQFEDFFSAINNQSKVKSNLYQGYMDVKFIDDAIELASKSRLCLSNNKDLFIDN